MWTHVNFQGIHRPGELRPTFTGTEYRVQSLLFTVYCLLFTVLVVAVVWNISYSTVVLIQQKVDMGYLYSRVGHSARTVQPQSWQSWLQGAVTKKCVVVVVFFTLTDRASTIPNNTRGCQSGTWSAGQKKIRGTSTKLQWEQRKTQTHKRQRERNMNNKIHRSEKDKRAAFDRESLAWCRPRAIRYLPRLATMHPPPKKKQKKKRVASTTFRTLRVSVPLMAQSTSLRESLGWPNQRGSKTS